MTDRSPTLATLEHTREELVRAQWTQWRTFLQAQLQLLAARAATDQPAHPFEHDPHGPAAQEAAAETQVAALDPQRRALFAQVYEQARQAAQASAEQERAALPADARGTPLDPDRIDRQVLQELLDDAEGHGPRAPRGRVPIEPGRWWVVEAEAFLAAPTLNAYQIAGARRRGAKTRAYGGLVGMLVVGVVAVLAFWFWPQPTQRQHASGQPVLAAGVPVEPWPLRTLQLIGSGVPSTTIPLTAAAPTTCADLPGDGVTVAVLGGTAVPLNLCVGGVALERVDTVVLVAQGDLPTRRYGRTSDPMPDLALYAPAGIPWFGALLATESPVDRNPGTAAALDDTTLVQVTAMTVAGPAEDATLPSDQMRVTVAVSAAGAVDWAALVPTLLSARGDLRETSATEETADGAQLHYTVPKTTEPLAFVWRITGPGGSPLRWRATLPPPPDRPTLLYQALTLADASASILPDDPTRVQLVLTVRNDGHVPLTLQTADIALSRDGQPVSVGTVDGLAEPLDPDATRTLTTSVALPPGASLTLSLGAARHTLTRP